MGCRCVAWLAVVPFLIVALLCPSSAAMEIFSTPATSIGQAPRGPSRRGVIILTANLRDVPSMQSEIVAVAKEGALLDVLEEKGQWFRVKTEAGVEAWVHKSLLRLEQGHLEPEPVYPSAAPTTTPAQLSPSPSSLLDHPLTASATTTSPGAASTTPLLVQAIGVAEPNSPMPTADFPLPLDLIVAHVQALSGYLLGGLAVILIISIGLQLRAARQLKRTMRDMSQILELVEAIQAESLPEAALSRAPAAAIAQAAVVSPPAPWQMISFTPVERVVIETIAEHGELHERELSKIIEEKGFPRVLIKAVIGDLVRKTATDGLSWLEARYVQGRFAYRLRVQGEPGSRHAGGQE